MKVSSAVLLSVFAPLACVFAGDPVPTGDLPEPVVAAVAEYLPGAAIASARVDEDDGRLTYKLRVDHGDLLLRVDVTSRGSVREIDMDGGFQGVNSLLAREAPVAVGKIPAPVAASVETCFPGSEILSAGEGDRDGRRYFKVNVRHRDLTLRMNVSAGGEILDIDTIKR